MKWNGHVTHISQKISRIVGIMYRLKHIYPKAVTLYSALIKIIISLFTHCNTVNGMTMVHI